MRLIPIFTFLCFYFLQTQKLCKLTRRKMSFRDWFLMFLTDYIFKNSKIRVQYVYFFTYYFVCSNIDSKYRNACFRENLIHYNPSINVITLLAHYEIFRTHQRRITIRATRRRDYTAIQICMYIHLNFSMTSIKQYHVPFFLKTNKNTHQSMDAHRTLERFFLAIFCVPNYPNSIICVNVVFVHFRHLWSVLNWIFAKKYCWGFWIRISI